MRENRKNYFAKTQKQTLYLPAGAHCTPLRSVIIPPIF